jgi:hypothetical protein
MYEILSTIKRLKDHIKERNEKEKNQMQAFYGMFGGKKR